MFKKKVPWGQEDPRTSVMVLPSLQDQVLEATDSLVTVEIKNPQVSCVQGSLHLCPWLYSPFFPVLLLVTQRVTLLHCSVTSRLFWLPVACLATAALQSSR